MTKVVLQWDINELKPHIKNTKIYGQEELPESFLANIQRKGILEPLVIKEDGTIISGHRRWRAARAVGLKNVPVRVVAFETELDEIEAIIDFNRQREKTFSQVMREAEEVEAIERERARERQATSTGGTKPQLREIFPQADKGKTRDKVATKTGIGSGKQYEKAKNVWEQAKAGDEKAMQCVNQIDSGSLTIHSAHKKINHKTPAEIPPLPEGQY